MLLKLMNGPLHGLEIDSRTVPPYVDLLDQSSGKVRRYSVHPFVMFSKEWSTMEEYRKENSGNQLPLPLPDEEATEVE